MGILSKGKLKLPKLSPKSRKRSDRSKDGDSETSSENDATLSVRTSDEALLPIDDSVLYDFHKNLMSPKAASTAATPNMLFSSYFFRSQPPSHKWGCFVEEPENQNAEQHVHDDIGPLFFCRQESEDEDETSLAGERTSLLRGRNNRLKSPANDLLRGWNKRDRLKVSDSSRSCCDESDDEAYQSLLSDWEASRTHRQLGFDIDEVGNGDDDSEEDFEVDFDDKTPLILVPLSFNAKHRQKSKDYAKDAGRAKLKDFVGQDSPPSSKEVSEKVEMSARKMEEYPDPELHLNDSNASDDSDEENQSTSASSGRQLLDKAIKRHRENLIQPYQNKTPSFKRRAPKRVSQPSAVTRAFTINLSTVTELPSEDERTDATASPLPSMLDPLDLSMQESI